MSNASALGMLETHELTWPVTFRYHYYIGGRGTSHEMTVDAFSLIGLHDETLELGALLWRATIATAICTSAALVFFDYIIHKEGPAVGLGSGGFSQGRLFATPAPRDRTAVLMLNTGHLDPYGRRRHFIYGMPYNWQDGNGLTSRGWDGSMAYAHLLAGGLGGNYIGGGLQLLLAYWNVIPRSLDNFYGVAFRRVTSYTVFQYTDKAPEPPSVNWPPSPS